MENLYSDTILHGDVYACLNTLNDNSVSVAITSPPYWKQRDYKYINQIGQENTPEEYIGRLITIFNILLQKLKKTGIFFLNTGDKYLNQYGKSHLLQLPYRLAYHMTKNGWILLDIIIWHKPNHMPSHFSDRLTNTYEPILVLAKNKNNIYIKNLPNVIEIPLQHSKWPHPATFPENLILELLNRTSLNDYDSVLDPFAGTGTTAAAVSKFKNSLFGKNILSISIEYSNEYINIIKKRTNINNTINVKHLNYHYLPVIDNDLPDNIHPTPILNNKHREIYIAPNPINFLSAIKGLNTQEFKNYHLNHALYFFGLKNWTIDTLYYTHIINKYGYSLRNMIVVPHKNNWYPIFMFANTSSLYKLHIDNVRIKPKSISTPNWSNKNFLYIPVKNTSEKKHTSGYIINIIENYTDNFPKIATVKWNNSYSTEFILHPLHNDIIPNSISFLCPSCKSPLPNLLYLNLLNSCPQCNSTIWTNINNVPIIKESISLPIIPNNIPHIPIDNININNISTNKKSHSKFLNMDKINLGASPSARKTTSQEYFSKSRLYNINQPIVAHYLNILKSSKNISTTNIISNLPPSYKHTAIHWFRTDTGGSIPIPSDIQLLKNILNAHNDPLLNILQKTTLKFQTVKNSIKGKNPGDFLYINDTLLPFLNSLLSPTPLQYNIFPPI